jgi:ABC-type uncharacterized transport system permease subunit
MAFATAGWLLVPLTMIAGFAAGAFWGFIPGVLKARFGVNEILSTVMLNVVAAQILLAMLKGPLMDTTGVTAGTFRHRLNNCRRRLAAQAAADPVHTGAMWPSFWRLSFTLQARRRLSHSCGGLNRRSALCGHSRADHQIC